MITKRQKQILDFIEVYLRKNRYAPSHEEIAKHFKLSSVGTVNEHIQKLIEKGFLKKEEGRFRAISISDPEKRKLTSIPLLGIISAGHPIEAVRTREQIEVPPNMISQDANYFALRVAGESMIEEGISSGDVVIVREQQIVNDGEKAVVYLPEKNTVTLKKVYKDRRGVKLVPANKYMKPFYETNVEIQGRVVGVLRKES